MMVECFVRLELHQMTAGQRDGKSEVRRRTRGIIRAAG